MTVATPEEPMAVRHFIDGAFVDSLDGKTFDSISPIDNAVVAAAVSYTHLTLPTKRIV